MRLLFLTNLYPPHDRGGLEQLCQEIRVGLQERGHTIEVLTSNYGTSSKIESANGVRRSLYLQADVEVYKPLDFFLNRGQQERNNVRELRQAIDSLSPDLIWIWGMWNLSKKLPYLAEQWMPGKIVYFLASYWPIDPDIHLNYWQLPANRPWAKLIKFPLRTLALSQLRREGDPPTLKFEHAACVSNYVRNTLVQPGKLPDSTDLIYVGIDPEPFWEDTSTKPNDGPLRLLYFGSVVPHKGVHTAIEAMGLLKQYGLLDSVELTILGGGSPDYEAQLKAKASELNIEDYVEFVGWVSRDEIPAWLKRFDVYLFTSIWAEPLGRTIIEAMASGLVVIGADVGGSREIFEHYSKELLFQPDDAQGLTKCIMRLLDDPSLRQRLVETGQQMVLERFTLEQTLDNFECWLQNTITKNQDKL